MEPPYWHQPVRQLYGATLLQFGRAANAEKTKIGWSLYMVQLLIEKRFRDAWRLADITLTASNF